MSHDVVPPDDQELMNTVQDLPGPGSAELSPSSEPTAGQVAAHAIGSLDAIISQIDAELQTAGPARSVLASSVKSARRRAGETKHIIVQLDRSVIAMPISHLVEVQRVPAITSIPHVPEWMRGVANLRGEIISVVDGRTFFGMPASDHGFHRRLVIVQSLQQERTTGLIVDRVVGMRSLHPDQVRQTTAPTSSSIGRFLTGVVADDDQALGVQTLCVIDLERFFSSEEMSQFELA